MSTSPRGGQECPPHRQARMPAPPIASRVSRSCKNAKGVWARLPPSRSSIDNHGSARASPSRIVLVSLSLRPAHEYTSAMPVKVIAGAVVIALLSTFALGSERPVTLDVWPEKVPGETGQIGPEKTEQKSGPIPVTLVTNITKP